MSQRNGRRSRGDAMMDHMTSAGMMWGTGIVWVLVIGVLLLAAAALVKYLFFSGHCKSSRVEGLQTRL